MSRKNQMSHPAPRASLKMIWFSSSGDKDVKLKSWWGSLVAVRLWVWKHENCRFSCKICMTLWLLKSVCFLGRFTEVIKHFGNSVGILEAATLSDKILAVCPATRRASDGQYLRKWNVKSLNLKICFFRFAFLFFTLLFFTLPLMAGLRLGSQGLPAKSKQVSQFPMPELYDGSSTWDAWSGGQALSDASV